MDSETDSETSTIESETRHSDSCPVCTDQLSEPVALNCGHTMCWSCFYTWAFHRSDQDHPPACPICRVETETLLRLYMGSGRTVEIVGDLQIPPIATINDNSWRQNLLGSGHGQGQGGSVVMRQRGVVPGRRFGNRGRFVPGPFGRGASGPSGRAIQEPSGRGLQEPSGRAIQEPRPGTSVRGGRPSSPGGPGPSTRGGPGHSARGGAEPSDLGGPYVRGDVPSSLSGPVPSTRGGLGRSARGGAEPSARIGGGPSARGGPDGPGSSPRGGGGRPSARGSPGPSGRGGLGPSARGGASPFLPGESLFGLRRSSRSRRTNPRFSDFVMNEPGNSSNLPVDDDNEDLPDLNYVDVLSYRLGIPPPTAPSDLPPSPMTTQALSPGPPGSQTPSNQGGSQSRDGSLESSPRHSQSFSLNQNQFDPNNSPTGSYHDDVSMENHQQVNPNNSPTGSYNYDLATNGMDSPESESESHLPPPIEEESSDNNRFRATNLFPGSSSSSYYEIVSETLLEELRLHPVPFQSVNWTQMVRATRSHHEEAFSGFNVKAAAQQIKRMMKRSLKCFNEDRPILPLTSRPGSLRQSRLTQIWREIAQCFHSAPVGNTRQNGARRGGRGGGGRGTYFSRRSLVSPSVGQIANGPPEPVNPIAAPQVASDSSSVSPSAAEQVGRREVAGAAIRRASLGEFIQRRPNNNRRLSTEISTLSSNLVDLTRSRERFETSTSIGDFGRRIENREQSREIERRRSDERRTEERRRQDLREDERARRQDVREDERARSNLVMVAALTRNAQLSENLKLREIVLFKEIDQNQDDNEVQASPDYPIKIKIETIEKLKKDIAQFLEIELVESCSVVIKKQQESCIITDISQVTMSSAYVQVKMKRGNLFYVLTEKTD